MSTDLLLPGSVPGTPAAPRGRHPLLAAVGRTVGTMTLVLLVVVALWVAALWAFDVSTFVGKGPADVAEILFLDEDAPELRAEIAGLLGQTLLDAGIGFVAGMLAAVGLAVVVVRSRTAESAVMPLALVLQTVPLIALAPMLILAVGRGYPVVALMSAIVVLFPALVTIVIGLRSVSPQMRDLVLVYGASPMTVLRTVAFPSALPALFASVRIAVPGSMTGALLAEWLATGKGIGYAVVSAAGRSQIGKVWALVVVITVVSLLLYLLAQLVEALVLSRFGQADRA